MNARLVLFFGLRQSRLEFQQLFIMPILADQVDCENATILITSNSQRNPTLCIVELAR